MNTVTRIIAGVSIAAGMAVAPGALGQNVTKTEYEKDQMPGRPGFEKFREYDQRRTEQLEKMAEGGGVNGAIARFYLKKEIEEANQLILDTDLGHWTNHIRQFALYEMFNADNGHRAKLMSREATDKLHAHMWECFQPKHGKGPWGNCRHYPVNPEKPSEHWGNQNHGFVFQSWFYTAATALKDIPKYASQFDPNTNIFGYSEVGAEEGRWANGDKAETMADYAESLRQMWINRFRWMAGEGVWWEDKVYRQYSLATLYNMATHANDPVIRKRASMMLDVHWLIYAQHMVDGQLGGAMNRYKRHYNRYHYDRGLGSYYFGGRGGGFHATEVAMYTEYVPPQIAYDLLADQKKRGCFTYRERLAASGSVYKQSYVTPEYVLGSYIKHDKLSEWIRYSERAFQGITFGQARAQLRLRPGATWQTYHGLQHGPVLLTRWFGKATPFLSIYATGKGGAEIETPVVENGWVFGKAGNAYYALRPAEGEFAVDGLRFNFPEGKPEVPFVLHAGGVTEDGSFEDFKKKVLANTLSYKDGTLAYTDAKWGTMQFAPIADTPADVVTGDPVPNTWPTHDPKIENSRWWSSFGGWGNSVNDHWLAFDLGQEYPVADLYIWQRYAGWGGENTALKDVDIRFATDNAAWDGMDAYAGSDPARLPDGWGDTVSLAFKKATGIPVTGDLERLGEEPVTARYVLFDIRSHWGNTKSLSLGEVRFITPRGIVIKPTQAKASHDSERAIYAIDGHSLRDKNGSLRWVNGEPVELPDKLFDSPYLTSEYDSGVITATFGGRKLVLDFNKNERRVE